MVLSINLAHGDREMEKERDRILGLTGVMREQAALQNREYGMRCFQGGYEFLVYDPHKSSWQRIDDDRLMHARTLPHGLDFELAGRWAQGGAAGTGCAADELAPQVMLYSSGELSLFELTLRREPTGAGVRFAPSVNSDRIEATALAAGAA